VGGTLGVEDKGYGYIKLDASGINVLANTEQILEYGINTENRTVGTSWQNDIEFNGLEPDTAYYFFVRSRANTHCAAGESLPAIMVSTEVIPPCLLGIHDFTVKNTTVLKRRTYQTCEQPETYWYSCSDCGLTSGTDYYTVLEPAGHDYRDKIPNWNHMRSPLSCTERATYWFACKECGDISGTDWYEGEEPPTGHHYGFAYDLHNHWDECRYCGDQKDVKEHWWEWIQIESNTCADGIRVQYCPCGYMRDEEVWPAAHNFNGQIINADTLRSAASCAHAAAYWLSCTDCGGLSGEYYFEDGEPDPDNHIFTAETVNNITLRSKAAKKAKATYWHSCAECGEISDALWFEYGDFKSGCGSVTAGGSPGGAGISATVAVSLILLSLKKKKLRSIL